MLIRRLAIALLLAAGCGTSSSQGPARASPAPSTAACEVSASRPGNQLSSDLGYGSAYGPGPVYVLTDGGLGPKDGRWRGAKILWIASPEVKGQVAIRGGGVAWGSGDNSVLWAPTGTLQGGWSAEPSTMLVAAPGCFRLDVTGGSFTEAITIRLGSG